MAALISSVMHTKDKVPFFVSRCEEMGIEVLPPDVNESGHDFVVSPVAGDVEHDRAGHGRVRFGLDAVKNVGSAAVDAIVAARSEGGPFPSIWDFCERVDCRAVNRKAIESLVKCGALDSTGASRRGMLEVLEQAQAAGQQAQQDALLGQGSIFDLGEPGGSSSPAGAFRPPAPPVPRIADDRAERGAMEKETLGLFLSSHPLKDIRPALAERVDCSLRALADKPDGEWVTVGGVIVECKRIRTKKGDPMMFATLDDLDGQVELLVFNSAYASNAGEVEVDRVLLVRGRVDHKEAGETKLVAQEVERFEPTPEDVERAREAAATPPEPKVLALRVDPAVAPSFLADLHDVARKFPGEHELRLEIGARRLALGPAYRLSGCSACRADLAALPGAAL
jgi:DNA polymerase-3 subunit alpha